MITAVKASVEMCSISFSMRADGILRGSEYPLITAENRLGKMVMQSTAWEGAAARSAAHQLSFVLCSFFSVCNAAVTSRGPVVLKVEVPCPIHCLFGDLEVCTEGNCRALAPCGESAPC